MTKRIVAMLVCLASSKSISIQIISLIWYTKVNMFLDIPVFLIPLLSVILVSVTSAWAARTIKERFAQKTSDRKDPQEREDFVLPSADESSIEKASQNSVDGTANILSAYKTIYHKVQNLEDQDQSFIQQAWNSLIAFLDEAIANALQTPDSGILSLTEYGQATLSAYLHRQEAAVSEEWEQYLRRRKAGSPRELFQTRDEAILWLKARAPVKFVDGAWLGHVHKITTPFPLRHITKDAWQVLSEELGDGDLEKNHVHVFVRLLDSIGAHLPRGDSVDFTHESLGLDDIQQWKAGLTQLLISLFPHDFLPEILGFNMHFELIAVQTLKASKELAELKIDPYYFNLHITIDNSDSGHSAVALQTVSNYIEHMRMTQGDEAAHQAWRRVQAGYALSHFLGTGHTKNSPEPSKLQADILPIFKSKALAAHKVHCNSRLKIGRHTLTDWLRPDLWDSAEHQQDFLFDLMNCQPWITRGESKTSRFIKELKWGGKMFGAFTQRETKVIEQWIDSQADEQSPQNGTYWSFIGLDGRHLKQVETEKWDICTDYPVLQSPYPSVHPLTSKDSYLPDNPTPSSLFPNASSPYTLHGKISPTSKINMRTLLPLWFTHPCLLEALITIPAKTTTPTASAIVRLLRAQSGFNIESSGVDGMDEARRTDSTGIIELGFEMAKRSGNPIPGSVKEALEWWPSDFALRMLHAAMRPTRNFYTLLGLTWAFVELHEGIAGGEGVAQELLLPSGRIILGRIARREKTALGVCLGEMQGVGGAYGQFWGGYVLGRDEIARLI